MNSVAILSIIGLLTAPVEKGIIGNNFVRGESGTVYVAGWWTNPDLSRLPNGETVTNLTVSASLKQDAVTALGQGKAVVIHGLTDMQTALDAFGLVRCNADGSLPVVEE
jgi:hypothetical protein